MSDTSPHPFGLSTPFVGRAVESSALNSALRSPGVVVLSGAMGVGKSRLAKEIWHQLITSGLHGVWFDLRHSNPGSWLRDISADFVEPFLTDAELKAEWVSRRLQTKTSVVVFDNAEHLTQDLPSAVAWLSDRLPETAFLVTTRERWQLAPLPRHIRLEPLGAQDAVDLVKARSPHLSLDERTQERLIHVTGGLPLAMEMALEVAQNLGFDQGIEAGIEALSENSNDSRLLSLIRMSLGRLNAEAIRLLACAAAIELPFTTKDLAPLCGLDEPLVRNTLLRLGTMSLLRPNEQGSLVLYPLVRAATEMAAPELFAEAMRRRLFQLAESTQAHDSESGERWRKMESLASAVEQCVEWHLDDGIDEAKRVPLLTCINALHELYCQRGFRPEDVEFEEVVDRSEVREEPVTKTCRAERLLMTLRREEAIDLCAASIPTVDNPILRARLLLVSADCHLQLYRDYDTTLRILDEVDLLIAELSDPTSRAEMTLRRRCVLLYLRGQEDRYADLQQTARSVRKDAARLGDWTSHGRAILCETLVALSDGKYESITNLWLEALTERHGFSLPFRTGGAPALYSLMLTGKEREARALSQHYQDLGIEAQRQQLVIANIALAIVFADDELLGSALSASSNPKDSVPLLQRMDAALRSVGFVALGDLTSAHTEFNRMKVLPLHSSENYPGAEARIAQLERLIEQLLDDRSQNASAAEISLESIAHTKDWILPIVQSVVASLINRRLLTVGLHDKSIEGLPSRLDLSRKPTLWAVFVALVQQHQTAPEQPLSSEALFRAAWPDEANTSKTAADARVRVAVHKLRAMGLSDHITHTASGYALQSSVKIRTR